MLISPQSSKDVLFGKLQEFGNYKLPINLCNLAAMCREHGYIPKIIDLNISHLSFKQLCTEISEFRPRCIGITAFTIDINSASHLAKAIKEQFPDVVTIIGGVHLSSLPERTMRDTPHYDYGVIGEGDITLLELLEAVAHNRAEKSTVDGIIFRREGELIKTAPRTLISNLDELPFPAYDIVSNLDAYQPSLHRRSARKSMMVITSRGCPLKCTFCDRSVLGHRYRTHSVVYVIEMMKYLSERFDIRHFYIEDENMGLHAEWLHDFCDSLISELADITWTCSMRADLVTEEKLKKMYAAGCRNITFGIESGSQKMLDRYQKNLKVDTILGAVKLVRRNKIGISGSFIIGGVGETTETINESIRFLKKIDLDFFYVWYLAPVPGSEVFKDIDCYGQVVSHHWDDYSGQKIVFIPSGLTKYQLQKAYKRYYRTFYLKPSFILSRVKSLSNVRELLGIKTIFWQE